MLPVDATTQQQMLAQVSGCGVAASDLVMEIDEGGGDLYVTIKTRKVADRQISCLMAAERVRPYPIFMFADRDASRRYYELAEIEGRKEARQWLDQRGLLAKLPSFDPATEGVSSYAARLERFCGLKAGSVLTLYRPGMLTIRNEWVEAQIKNRAAPKQVENDRFMCLMNAISASNLKERGVEFGIIGNDYVAEPKQP